MANSVMLECFIENVCQIALVWEGVIINSRKPLKSMCFCNYHDSLSISKFTLPGRNDPFNFMPELSIKASMFV